MAMTQIFTDLAADGNSGALSVTAGDLDLIVVSDGVDGGGTLTVQLSPDNGVTFVDSGVTGLTAAGTMRVVVPDEAQVRLLLAGATTPTLNVWANAAIPSS